MSLDIAKLDDKGLMEFFNSLDDKEVRRLLSVNHEIAALVKGWRAQSIPLDKLKAAAIQYTHGSHRLALYRQLNDELNEADRRIEVLKDAEMKDGLSEAAAYAFSISQGLSLGFQPEYIKLKEFDPDLLREVQASLTSIRLFERLGSNKDAVQEVEKKVGKNAGSISDVNKKASDNADVIKELSDAQKATKNAILELQKSLKSVSDEVTGLKEKPQDSRIEATFKKLESQAQQLEVRLKTMEDTLKQALEKQEAEISALKESAVVSKESPFSIETIAPGDYDEDDGSSGIEDIIDDVSLGLIASQTKDNLGLYRSFINDALYSDRLFFAEKNKAVHLCKVLSGILSGQGYCHITCNATASPEDLYEQVSQKIQPNSYTVFLIDGFLGQAKFQATAKKLRDLSSKAKFVFSIDNAKSTRFLPESILEDFYFFDAPINQAGVSEYIYICQLPQKQFTNSSLLASCLASLSTSGLAVPATVTDGLGLIRYSYLPFYAFHEDKDLEEIANQLDDPSILEKIGGSLDE